MTNFAGILLKAFGWSVECTLPDRPKCIICVAPHTSNWDFILGKLAYSSLRRKARFLIKEAWFFWPMSCFFKAIGGIPVPKKRGSALTEAIIDEFRHSPELTLAITPEGTRSRTDRWRTGFLHIAAGAHVPVYLAAIDYKDKKIILSQQFTPTGDTEADMRSIKEYYSRFNARYPEKFSTGTEL